MFWHKVQHHFLFFFLSFILLTQGLVFVASQAVSLKNYKLKVDYLSPQSGQFVLHDQSLFLRAKIVETDKNIGPVYFVMSDPDNNFKISFETQKGSDNIYTSLSLWQAADWPTGVYSINMQASILNEQGVVIGSQESEPSWVKVISSEEYNSLLSSRGENININAVATNNTINQNTDEATANALSTDTKNQEGIEAEQTAVTTSTSTATSTSATTATNTATTTPDLVVASPENNTTISSKLFLVDLTTNFLSEKVTIEFINTDNAAISTRDILIDKTDGYRWVKNIELDNSFIDGSYKLLVSAAIPDSNLAVNKTFDYTLDAPSAIKPEDLFIHLVNLPSNLQGSIGLRAEANLKIDNLDFVVEDAINRLEALRIKGLDDSIADDQGAVFSGLWDTAVLANGNYLVYVESRIDEQKVGSVKQLVSIYNNNNAAADETLANDSFEEPKPSGPSDLDLATSSLPKPETIANSIDCQRSGIDDPALCQQYQAEINDSLAMACIEKNIFNSENCEKYIFESKNNTCLEQKINDPIKCREYLYQKYAKDLSCNITATSTCPQVVRDEYIARLAYELEQKNKFLNIIKNLDANNLTLNALNDELVVADLGRSNLSLVPSDKKIKILKIKNQNNLDETNNLYFSAPVGIMSDGDGDALPDDLESYYGTDPKKADSDDDGHLDGEEIAKGYDPLSAGKLGKDRLALEELLATGASIEEPRLSNVAELENWSVSSAQASSRGLQLSGKATPDTWVNIFVYSAVPLVMSTQTDASGQWSYSLIDPLTEGVHQVYVASHDQSGKLLARSAPITFLVANIRDDLPPVGVGQEIMVIGEEAAAKNWTIYYVGGGALLLLVLLLLVFGWLKHRRQKKEKVFISSEPVQKINNTELHVPAIDIADKINLPETKIETVESPTLNTENKDQENHA